MKKEKRGEKEGKRSGVSRRNFCKAVVGISLGGAWSTLALFASAEDVPAEPENLDEPTPWQEGDPEPVEKKVPAEEPEQISAEAPPSQPMDDERPEQPGPDYAWATGYWWWTNRTYMWIPGYWALPPRTNYVYVSGYWTYRGNRWVYVRGGWAKPNTTAIVVYARPRPLLTAFVITAPIRIVRRHRRWRHYHARRAHHRAVRRSHRRRLKRRLGRPERPRRR
jgi:hypothetical protein